MKKDKWLNSDELLRRGHEALLRELGPLNYVRFIQHVSPGRGDFAQRRRKWVDELSVNDVFELVEAHRRERKSSAKRRGRNAAA